MLNKMAGSWRGFILFIASDSFLRAISSRARRRGGDL